LSGNYIRDRRTVPSQTWRAFLANYFGQLTCALPLMFCGAPDEDEGVDLCGVLPRPAPASGEWSCVSVQWSVIHWPLSLQRLPVDGRIGQADVRRRDANTPAPARTHRKRRQSHAIRTHIADGSIRPESPYGFRCQ